MGLSSGVDVWAEGVRAELKKKLPGQRKTQRDKLGLLVATMLHVRSANLVELASGLPRPTDRTDMRYQWISRFLANDTGEPLKGLAVSPLAGRGLRPLGRRLNGG